MKTKSVPVRRSRGKSLDPYPPLPERFGSREMDPDTCRGERGDVGPPHKKRQSPLEADIGGSHTCIVCDVSDERVSSCSGVDCLVRFHEECLTPELGGSEDLSNPFCPYCWLKVVSHESNSLREEAVRAEKAACKYLLDKGIEERDHGQLVVYSSKEDQFDKDSHQPEDVGIEEDEAQTSEEDQERVAAENVQDAGGDDELAQAQTIASQVQQNENDNGRRRRVEMNATDSDISSTMEPDGENVSERGATNNVAAQPNTLRNFSFFDKDQTRRIFWTPKEEEMLRMGVEKFTPEINKNMPWRKILKMGQNVFHKGRTSTDLKEKWRNMPKAQH